MRLLVCVVIVSLSITHEVGASLFPEKTRLGVLLRETKNPRQLTVDRVFRDSIADHAGIKLGDVIIEVNDRLSPTLDEFKSTPYPLTVRVIRVVNGATEYQTIKVEDRPTTRMILRISNPYSAFRNRQVSGKMREEVHLLFTGKDIANPTVPDIAVSFRQSLVWQATLFDEVIRDGSRILIVVGWYDEFGAFYANEVHRVIPMAP